MAATSGVFFVSLADSESFTITAPTDASSGWTPFFGVAWQVQSGTLTVTSNRSAIINSVNTSSESTTYTSSNPAGNIPARNQVAPLDGITFSSAGGTTILMLFL